MQCNPTNRVLARVFAPAATPPFFADLEKGFDAAWRRAFRESRENGSGEFRPAATSYEDESAFYLELDAPGISADQVQVSAEGQCLEVSWERKPAEPTPKQWRNERRFGKFRRKFEFGEEANLDQVEARLDMGVLRLKVAKQPVPGRKQIPVQG
jgi:HSP20 family molecular chaperone IbpA